MPKMIAHALKNSKWLKYGLFEDGSYKVNSVRSSTWRRIAVAFAFFSVVRPSPPKQRPRPATLRKSESRQPGTLQRNQSDFTPKSQGSSRRDHQGAATLHETRQGTPTLVSL